MDSSSPQDLAVAFRSLPRRLRDARGELTDAEVAAPLGEIERHLAACARLLATTAEPTELAAAIEAVPAARWDEAVLDELRRRALELGALVRTIEALPRPD
jgi:hypothetical protein